MSNSPTVFRVCLFRLADRVFALDVRSVREVVEVGLLSSIPLAPAEVLGLFSVRGEILPLVSLAALLGLAGAASSSRAVVVRHGEQQVALAVSEVLGLEALPLEPTKGEEEAPAAYAEGELIWRGQRVPLLSAQQLLGALARRVEGGPAGAVA
ncbi:MULTISPECIES: chemotaxis protein CheW [unclassified Meiothermus]|uniref:chemotaxis protein CheW n=1 Tax=unclassified Meiothermus TaxID=370471 RepID=UPI000D7CD262|nr:MULTISPECIES: chemotaxis protein CheW [unclassified Meiothermus]PZA06886.1 hypothetical protein DNA98_09395 [Meiothermus sp. Pnk-1]RYM30866.1 chemotaxis protein CheW [Meiothermus sp. PNK-Is4]